MKFHLFILFLLLLIVFGATAQEDFYYYGCENCAMTSLVPFGDKKVVTYLEKSNTNTSKLFLLNKSNIGLDTLTGWLSGYRKIIKTGNNSFTSIGDATVKYFFKDDEINIERAIGIRYFPNITINGLTIGDHMVFWNNYVVISFRSLEYAKIKKQQGLKSIHSQFYLLPTNSLINNPDVTASGKNYYGGRVPDERNHIIDGKTDHVNRGFIPLTEKVVIETSEYYDPAYAINGSKLLILDRNEQVLYEVTEKEGEVKTKRILLNVDSEKFRMADVYIDLEVSKDYLLVYNKTEKNNEIWELDTLRNSFKGIGRTSYYPYLIDNGFSYVKLINDKRVDILRLPLYSK
jgi:hypothetical protein